MSHIRKSDRRAAERRFDITRRKSMRGGVVRKNTPPDPVAVEAVSVAVTADERRVLKTVEVNEYAG